MSDEGTDSPVTPQRIELDSRNISSIAADGSVSPSHGCNRRAFHRRASVSSFSAGSSGTRNSTGKSDFVSSSQNAVSRYLRASTGSCHDFCKYGMKHSSEEVARTTLLQKTTVSDERKNVRVSDHHPPSDTRTQLLYSKPAADAKAHSQKPKSSLDKEKTVKHRLSIDSRNDHRSHKMSLDAKTSSPRQNRTPLLKNRPSAGKKFSSPTPPEVIKSIFFPSENVGAKVEQGSLTVSKMPRSGKKTMSPSGQHSSVKPNPVKVKPALGSEKSDVAGAKEGENNGAETGRNITASKASVKKISEPSAASLSPDLSLIKTASNRPRKAGSFKFVSSPKVQHRVGGDNSSTSNKEKVFEKTLHVIPDNGAISSFPSSSCPRSGSRAQPLSLLLSHEENKETEYGDGDQGENISDNDASLEIGSKLPVRNREDDNEEIGQTGRGPDRCIFDHDESPEIAKVQPAGDDHAVSLFSSPLSTKSLSQTEPSSLLPHKEDNREMEYHDGRPGQFVPGSDESVEIGDKQPIPNGNPDSYAESSILSPCDEDSKEFLCGDGKEGQFIWENDESLEIGDMLPSSVSPYDEGNKEIYYHDGEPHENISENDESPEIGKAQSILDSHTSSSLPTPSSAESDSYAESSSSSSHDEEETEKIESIDGELDEFIPDNDEPTQNGNVQSAKENHKMCRKSAGIAISEENHGSPVKLKFKPGRIIDLQSDDNGPRRLRFRRSRDLRAEHRKDAPRTLKKPGAECIKVAAEETPSSEKVVLKHQDVQDKKDSQVLFNNVIEETASKLVETRKSKVKALVGAFETVISLQESKPSPS